MIVMAWRSGLGCMLAVLFWASAQALTLAWDASPGASGYKLYYGLASGSYDTVVDSGEALQVALSGLSPGQTYWFAVTAYNAAEERGVSREISYRLPLADIVPPRVAITNPVAGTTVPKGETTSIDVDATDNIGVVTVAVAIDGMLLPSLSSMPYRWSWKVGNANRRLYHLQASARDAAGNLGLSAVIEVTSSN